MAFTTFSVQGNILLFPGHRIHILGLTSTFALVTDLCCPCRRDALLAQDAEMEMAKRRKVLHSCQIDHFACIHTGKIADSALNSSFSLDHSSQISCLSSICDSLLKRVAPCRWAAACWSWIQKGCISPRHERQEQPMRLSCPLCGDSLGTSQLTCSEELLMRSWLCSRMTALR